MTSRRNALRALVGSLGVLCLLTLAVPDAGAAVEVVEVEGSAFALFVQGETPDPVPSPPAALTPANGEATPQAVLAFGPAPFVELPPEGGGPITDSFANVNLALGLLTSGIGEASTEGSLGPDGTVASSASLADLDIAEGTASASLISAECTSGLDGPDGSSSIVEGQIDGNPLPASPDPNTVIDLGPLGSITLNRQVVDGDRIEVTAIAVELTAFEFTGTLEIAQAVCGVTTADIPEEPAAEGPIAAEPVFTG